MEDTIQNGEIICKNQKKNKQETEETKSKIVSYIPDDNTYVFECPHCNLLVQVKEKDIRCKIFRHAVYKANNKPIPPHANKDLCEKLLQKGLIHGCAKPFRLRYKNVNDKSNFTAEICDYI